MISSDITLSVLHDHYKDSFGHVLANTKVRDRLFVYVLIMLIVMLFQAYAPVNAGDILSHSLSKWLNLDGTVDLAFLGSVVWFVLWALLTRYFQAVMNVEKEYSYIHLLETYLASLYEDGVFTREGNHYLDNYPIFLKWATRLYRVFFPCILIMVVLGRMLTELRQELWPFSFLTWVDMTLCVLTLITIGLYLLTLEKGKKKEGKKKDWQLPKFWFFQRRHRKTSS